MAKLTLSDIGSGFASEILINANNALIETALENTLSRDGTTPNAMSAAIDMGTNKIVNLEAPSASNDAARLVDITDLATPDIVIPSQSGNAGKVLGTDGSIVSWGGPSLSLDNTWTGDNIHSGDTTYEKGLNYIAATGTDTYVATLSPALTVYNTGAVYNISFTNANTSTTPTLNINGLGAKTIVTIDGLALLIGDINGYHILQYDGINLRLLNKADRPAISNYVQGVTTYLEDDVGAASALFDVDANIGLSWESIGPTGSGATNIWTALDDVPDGSKWVELKVSNLCTDTASEVIFQRLYARVVGSVQPLVNRTLISIASVEVTGAGVTTLATQTINVVKIPIDSTKSFELYFVAHGTSRTVAMYLVGFGI